MPFITNADLLVNNFLTGIRTSLATKIFLVVTYLGEVASIIVFALVASLIFLTYKNRWYLIAMWLSIFGSEGVTFVLKKIVNRARPLNPIITETSASFPSGHATIAVAFFGFIAYLLITKAKNKATKTLIFIVYLILALAIGFSRLYLGAHYLTDVLTGYLVGLAWFIIAVWFVKQTRLAK